MPRIVFSDGIELQLTERDRADLLAAIESATPGGTVKVDLPDGSTRHVGLSTAAHWRIIDDE